MAVPKQIFSVKNSSLTIQSSFIFLLHLSPRHVNCLQYGACTWLGAPSSRPSISLPDMLCDTTDLIWRKGTPFEAMTGHRPFIRRSPSRAFSEVFLSCNVKTRRSVYSPRDHSIITLIISDRRDWLGASGLWLGTRTGVGGTATLAKSFFERCPWLHGQLTL